MTRAQLMPLGPPGRATRKALAFHGEIVRLRACGYTLAAIREALADAGIQVSLATVSREVRHASAHGVAGVEPLSSDAASMPRAPTTWPPLNHAPSVPLTLRSDYPAARPEASTPPAACSGREQAEAFMRTVITNPLLRARSTR